MPNAKFRCKRCKRSFSMAAHLARHNNTIHGTKKKTAPKTAKKKAKKRVIKSKATRTVVATGSANVIQVMQAHHHNLLAQRASLDAQIAAFEQAMEAIGATASISAKRSTGKKRGRPVGSGAKKGTLKSYIHRVLSQVSKPLSPRDIAERVKRAGFKTKSQNLTRAVSNTLPSLKKVKRVSYGKYQLSG